MLVYLQKQRQHSWLEMCKVLSLLVVVSEVFGRLLKRWKTMHDSSRCSVFVTGSVRPVRSWATTTAQQFIQKLETRNRCKNLH